MIDRAQFKQRIHDLAQYTGEVRNQGANHKHFRGGKPEDNTKEKIIDRLLDVLGFTSPEFRIRETELGPKWVDYSLRAEADGPLLILVEAKPVFESDLWRRHRTQIYRYIQEYRIQSLEEDPVKWILLTNGHEVHILRINDREPHWSVVVGEDTADLLYDLLARVNVRDGVLDARYLEERKETLGKQFLEDLKTWRLILANGFYAKQPHLSLEELSEASQVYLNRLMFIRMLETYRLRPVAWLGRLYSHWKDAGWVAAIHPFSKEILRAFQDTEFRFNTELFKESRGDELEIGDEFVEAVIVPDRPIAEAVREKVGNGGLDLWTRTVYNYDFTELGVDVLGSVYERFLAHQFTIANGRVVIRGTDDPAEATKLRRKEGIYYTPGWVTRFIVGSCLKDRLSGLLREAVQALDRNEPQVALQTIRQATLIKVADIAMGSGSFLLQVYELFYEIYESYNEAVRRRRQALLEGAIRPDLTEIMQWAMLNDPATLALESLYGVDLDSQAVSLAKLNLWLRLLSKNADRYRHLNNVHHLLPRLDLQFRRGNSLITASRLDRFAAEAAARRDAFAEAHGLFATAKTEPSEENITRFLEASARLSDDLSSIQLPEFFGEGTAARAPLVLEAAFPHVFVQPDGTLLEDGGFDAVVGNPPYEVLSWRERGISKDEERKEKRFLDEAYGTRFQKYNLYRFFFERGLDLVKPNGMFGYIVPLTLLADESSYRLRYMIFATSTVGGLYCFPERARVFEGVTQAVCIAILHKNKGWVGQGSETAWRQRLDETDVVPVAFDLMNERDLHEATPLTIPIARVRALHPRFYPIPQISARGWEAVDALSRFPLLKDWEDRGLIEVKQREINLNEDRELFGLTPTEHRLVRGEHIAPFELRLDIGAPEYVDRDAFLRKKGGGHFRSGSDHEQARVGIQEVSNLALVDRLKAAIVPAGYFVGHTVDYIVLKDGSVDIYYLLGLLNSEVLDWRFRLTSTNNHVTTNQILALPAPLGAEPAEVAQLAQELSKAAEGLTQLASQLETMRSAFAELLANTVPEMTELAWYLRDPRVQHQVLLYPRDREGMVVELALAVRDTRAVISATVAYREDYRTAPKYVEEIVALSSSDDSLLEFLCLALDRAIAEHRDRKWTDGNSLEAIYGTVTGALLVPRYSRYRDDNAEMIGRVLVDSGLNAGGFSRGLETREELRSRYHDTCRTIYGVAELPEFEGEAEEETNDDNGDENG